MLHRHQAVAVMKLFPTSSNLQPYALIGTVLTLSSVVKEKEGKHNRQQHRDKTKNRNNSKATSPKKRTEVWNEGFF